MKIKRITLHNFRQFMDMNIEFSTDKEKNVSIIIAENSTGKTTLMQSIKWCLYGDEETDLDNKTHLLNQYVQQNSNREKEELFVEVVIEEEGVDYTIRRTREVFRKNNRVSQENISIVYKDSGGETHIIKSATDSSNVEQKKINRMINKILTREMSRYFLFDGERINNLGNNNAKSKKDVREAIGAVNGFNILENSLTSLRNMGKEYRSNLSEGTHNKEIVKLDKQINALEDSKNNQIKTIEEVETKISYKETEIKQLDAELSMHDQIQHLTKQRKELEAKVIKDEQSVKNLQNEILRSSYSYRIKSMMLALKEKYRQIKFQEEYETKTIANMQADAIDQIIERGICICGEILTESHKNNLLAQRNYQPPISNAQLVKNFDIMLKDEMAGMDNDFNRLLHNREKYYEITNMIEVNKDDLKKLDEAIGNNDSQEIKNKNARRAELKKQINQLKEEKIRLKIHLEMDEQEIAKKERIYDELIREKNKNDFNTIKVKLVKDSIMILEQKNESEKQARKKQIEQKANEHFSEIIYKKKNISLNDNFEYTVREEDGSTASPSEGERISISMSLILAIIDSHKERIKEKKSVQQDYNYINEKEFAIILDAAFATLDNQFSKRISRKLPKSVDQLILFSTERQFEGAVEDSLQKYVGKKYRLSIPKNSRENALTNEDLHELLLAEVK